MAAIAIGISLKYQGKNGGMTAEELKAYTTELKKLRTEKDKWLLTGEDSPFKGNPKFSRLNYFETDAEYRITAELTRAADTSGFEMKTTTERLATYYRKYVASFTLQDKPVELLIYQNKDDLGTNAYFLPFKDQSNSKESYSGGRYIDIEIEKGATKAIIDFNKAYNPYCNYNKEYSCPIPPAENSIGLSIFAGEKNYIEDIQHWKKTSTYPR